MIQLEVQQASVDTLKSYLDRVRDRIIGGIRQGMQESMEALAATAVTKSVQAGIRIRKGKLVQAIADSPKVTQTPDAIHGTVSAEVGKKHLGLWLGEGFHDPAVRLRGAVMATKHGHSYSRGNPAKAYAFMTGDGSIVWTRGHRAFDVRARPFMNPALEAMKSPIMDLIAEKVREALR